MSQHLEYVIATERYARCPRCGNDFPSYFCACGLALKHRSVLNSSAMCSYLPLGKYEIQWFDKRLGQDGDATTIWITELDVKAAAIAQAKAKSRWFGKEVNLSEFMTKKLITLDYLLPFDIDEERLEKLLMLL